MRRKNRIRLALGLMLTAAIAGTCTVVYQSGNRSVPNEKEFVLNEGDSIDEAMKTEEKENTEENQNPENQNSETQNPETQDVNTSQVEGERQEEETTEESTEETTEESEETSTENLAQVQQDTGNEETQTEETASAGTEAVQSVPEVNFTESSLMQWPVEGQVLLDYNMEHTIYFPTLNEYKYSPAIAVGAEEGTPVLAVANGKVVSVVNNEETGLTMTVDLGNGYQVVYGQLKDTAFEPESYMEAGATLGYVNEPTKYYSKEGSNLYFAMTKDGVSVDPLEYLP